MKMKVLTNEFDGQIVKIVEGASQYQQQHEFRETGSRGDPVRASRSPRRQHRASQHQHKRVAAKPVPSPPDFGTLSSSRELFVTLGQCGING
uniref:Uncharacterized protein n=1 Tax=Anopheles albimanus TaxID=7167 RepID=A0A182F249_ANOAL